VAEPSDRAGRDSRSRRRRPGRQRVAAGQAAELSDVEVALLGLLSVRPMTGYDIRRHFDRALAPWWDTPRTQIYPKLRELETRRLIEHEYVVQESKPNKRVYSPTPAGRDRLRAWLEGSIQWPNLRHQMMMRLFLGHLLPADGLHGLLADYRDRTAQWSDMLREIETKFSRSLAGPYRDTVFFELLALRNLIALADLEVSAADRAVKALEQARDTARPGNGEVAGRLLDIIREFSV
jgi:PadR family transcriptional regulator, regulatory protein AphA